MTGGKYLDHLFASAGLAPINGDTGKRAEITGNVVVVCRGKSCFRADRHSRVGRKNHELVREYPQRDDPNKSKQLFPVPAPVNESRQNRRPEGENE